MKNFKVSDLVAWSEDGSDPVELAIVLSDPETSDIFQSIDGCYTQSEVVKVAWNTGNISNVPLKLIYLVNRR